ncbi:MAG: VOC family protein [Pseudomonadota bacterium]
MTHPVLGRDIYWGDILALACWTHGPNDPDPGTWWDTEEWGITDGPRAVALMHHGRRILIQLYDRDFGFSLQQWWTYLCEKRRPTLKAFFERRTDLIAQIETALTHPNRKALEVQAESGWAAFLEANANDSFWDIYTRPNGLNGDQDFFNLHERRQRMDQRVSLITLGVNHMERSAAFYDGLGWDRVQTQDGVIAYDLIGQTLGLYPLSKLADDLGIPVDQLGYGAMTLGYNAPDRETVNGIMTSATIKVYGKVLKPATDVFWGGYHGYFADPDGHIWEVAHNPFSPLGPNGEFQWNGVG